MAGTARLRDRLERVAEEVAPDHRRLITLLLRSFDLPVPGCDHLDDRDAVLARLDRR